MRDDKNIYFTFRLVPSLSCHSIYKENKFTKHKDRKTNFSHIFYTQNKISNQFHKRYNILEYSKIRSLHSTSCLFQDPKEDFKVLEEKNRIEEYVEYQRKKREQKEKLKIASQKFQEAFIFKADKTLATSDGLVKQDTAVVPGKRSIKETIVHEVKHYYNGFKLLYLDSRIAARLLWQTMNGKALSRRERKQVSTFIFRSFSVCILGHVNKEID